MERSLRVEALESRQLLAITVDSNIDERDASITDGDISLRDAIFSALPGETINFAPSLDGATILLDLSLDDLEIDKTVTIDASMLPNGLTIEAHDPTPTTNNGDGMRIFDIVGGHVTLKNLTLQGGDVKGSGGAIRARGDVSLTLDGVTIRENSALRDLTIAPSGNDRLGLGGGLFFETTSTQTLPPPRA